jgi:hypothetical protein
LDTQINLNFSSEVSLIGDDDIDSAVAVTLLRMYGYNAWILPVGVCGLQGTTVAGMAVSSGLTAQSQTVGGVTAGQTAGTISSTNY